LKSVKKYVIKSIVKYPETSVLRTFFKSSDWREIYSQEIKECSTPVLLCLEFSARRDSKVDGGKMDRVYLYHDALIVELEAQNNVHKRPDGFVPKSEISNDEESLDILVGLLRQKNGGKQLGNEEIVEMLGKKIDGHISRRRK
jgi:hypothetical protein